jgi:amino acid transporter
VALLGAFAMLNVMGISDSARVALAIFVFHMFTLSALVVIGVASLISDPSVFVQNLKTPISQWPTPHSGGVLIALFFGFSAAMLGISGFESSANYIEEQQPGVFPKTLRNMWMAVAVFNPVISLLAFALLPMGNIATHKEALLSEMGRRGAINVGGLSADTILPKFIAGWISLDAVVVLSGAVLTSYVGVTGLVRRMSMDLCLPQVLLRQNRWRGTNHWIVLSFFLLCCSILLITSRKIEMLAGVYTLSFLAVMGLFAVGNLLLKRKHPDLKRATRVSVATVVVALIGVLAGLVGNVLLDPEYVRVFLLYFAGAVAVVALMFFRSKLLTLALKSGKVLYRLPLLRRLRAGDAIEAALQEVQCRSIMFVASEGTADELRAAAAYVSRNEQLRFLKVVWCYEQDSEIPDGLAKTREEIDREFPLLHLDLLLVRGRLGPPLLAALGRRLAVSPNYIFITAATAASTNDLGSWGGVRIIA